MRLASFEHWSGAGFGAVKGDVILDLTGAFGHGTVASVLRSGDLARLAEVLPSRRLRLDDVVLLPPVCNGRAAFCIGVNYAERNEEYGDEAPAPYPSVFLRQPRSFVGHRTPIERPRVSEQLDYEGEIVLVIGREGRGIPRERALDHVAGLMLANEGSVRDWLRHAKFNVTPGKNFDRSGSLGPWMVTTDEIDPARELRLTTRVNGELRQDASTALMMFPFDHLIAYLSAFSTLEPGDLILTGTPVGAGARFSPPKWLVPGDRIDVEVEEIGRLTNLVARESD